MARAARVAGPVHLGPDLEDGRDDRVFGRRVARRRAERREDGADAVGE